MDVLGAPLKRRSYSRAEKARLVAETLEPGTRTADVARRHGIHPQVLYAWRRLARQGELALQAEDAPMFAAGSDRGGEHWATIASIVETCRLNAVNPQSYLADVLQRIVAGHPQSRIDDHMPWAHATL